MAGLQYYFFPTDFLYPRPQSAVRVNTSTQIKAPLPLQIENQEFSAHDLRVKQNPTTTSLVLYKSKSKLHSGNRASTVNKSS
ncbi:hypothetical protein Tsubulata_015113 [Turnera subulata]|uniref:Uncharacterized protein n=1 Tax=Turnera subulata TaxID=218843 RepID=A0A9Q0JKT3_9ROSI|nr:hypothetical protein Tsubulata_015113 [Turnera subulata]